MFLVLALMLLILLLIISLGFVSASHVVALLNLQDGQFGFTAASVHPSVHFSSL